MRRKESGQSLIEVLAALTVTSVVIVALVVVSLSGLKNSQFAQNQAKATKYAQDLIEKVKAIKDRNLEVEFQGNGERYTVSLSEFFHNGDQFKCPDVDNPCYFQLDSGTLSLSETTPDSRHEISGDLFTYEIAMWRSTTQEENIRVKVLWQDAQGEHESNLQTVMTPLDWVPTPSVTIAPMPTFTPTPSPTPTFGPTPTPTVPPTPTPTSTLGNGLVGYWKMDESSWNGTTGEVRDASGNNNHGTAQNGASIVTGQFGNAGSFDGVNDSINIGDVSSLEGLNRLTIAFWAYLPSDWSAANNDWNVIIDKCCGHVYAVQSTGPGSTIMQFGVVTTSSSAWVNIDDFGNYKGRWIHVVGTYDGSKVKTYLNSTFKSEKNLTGRVVTNSNSLGIGGRVNSTAADTHFYGKLDEVRIYNRAFSDTEVSNLYTLTP